MSKFPSITEQMFEIALKSKDLKTLKFAIEMKEFESEIKQKNQQYSGEGTCNISV